MPEAVPGDERLIAAARTLLRSDFLSERAERVADLAEWVAGFREFQRVAVNRRAVRVASWFQDAWCCPDWQAGRFSPPLVLAVQPTDLQRETAADLAARALAGVADEPTRATVVKAIRQMGVRDTIMPEAQIVREASNLDSVGLLWLWGQAAKCLAEDRPVKWVIGLWERQTDYHYWDRLIRETLRFERSRELARHRCRQLESCLIGLRDTLCGGDRHVASAKPAT